VHLPRGFSVYHLAKLVINLWLSLSTRGLRYDSDIRRLAPDYSDTCKSADMPSHGAMRQMSLPYLVEKTSRGYIVRPCFSVPLHFKQLNLIHPPFERCGGQVVEMLATGPEVPGFKGGCGQNSSNILFVYPAEDGYQALFRAG